MGEREKKIDKNEHEYATTIKPSDSLTDDDGKRREGLLLLSK